jgi:hypothetical protein
MSHQGIDMNCVRRVFGLTLGFMLAQAFLLMLVCFQSAHAQPVANEGVLLFDGRGDQTGTANGGAVLFSLEARTWRFWFQNVRYAHLSPDGTQVAYVFNNVRHIADFQGQNPKAWPALPDVDYTRLTSATWSPRGDRLAFFSSPPLSVDSDLNIVSPDGELLFRHRLEHGAHHFPPAWSPQSDRIAEQCGRRACRA